MTSKKRILSCALALAAIATAGAAWGQEKFYATGKYPMPGYPGYSIVTMTAERPAVIGKVFNHLYFIEKDGAPIAGVSNSYQQGKVRQNVATVVSASQETVPASAAVNCSTIKECETLLQHRKEQALLLEVQGCQSVQDCVQALTKLKAIYEKETAAPR